MPKTLRRPRHQLAAFGALLVTFISGASAMSGGGAGVHWPAPVAHFIERSALCLHFAGEIGGDGSPRDAEVIHEMNRLHCNLLAADLRTLRQRYRGDAQIRARLATFDDHGMPTEVDSEN